MCQEGRPRDATDRTLELQHKDLDVVVVRRKALLSGRGEIGAASHRKAEILLQVSTEFIGGPVPLLRVH